jgi:predicted protein tyrosine phosphatase
VRRWWCIATPASALDRQRLCRACLLNPHRGEISIARQIRAASIASPNRLIVSLADKALGREGRMLHALDEMGPAACWSKAGRSASISIELHDHRQMSENR